MFDGNWENASDFFFVDDFDNQFGIQTIETGIGSISEGPNFVGKTTLFRNEGCDVFHEVLVATIVVTLSIDVFKDFTFGAFGRNGIRDGDGAVNVNADVWNENGVFQSGVLFGSGHDTATSISCWGFIKNRTG